MTLATLIPVVLRFSAGVVIFCLAVRQNPRDLALFLRRPGLLFRSLVSMSLVMPLVAVALATAFDLRPAVKVAVVALSLSPIPPLLPRKEQRAGGSASYAVSLLITAGVLAIVLIPIGVELCEIASGRPLQISPAAVARIMLVTVLVPLAIGLLVRRLAPVFAERIAGPGSRVAVVLYVLGFLPVLITGMPEIIALLGNGTLAAVVAFIVAGLAAGHLLGGPAPDDRTVLALSTASRHPGVALAIAGANVSGSVKEQVLAALLLYLMANAVVSIPYLVWRRRQAGNPARQTT